MAGQSGPLFYIKQSGIIYLSKNIQPLSLIKMRILTTLITCICIATIVRAQTPAYKFVDGRNLTLSGRSVRVHSDYYHRIDASELPPLTKPVQHLAADAAGLNLNFKTDSKSIKVKWTLGKYEWYKNMTPIAINGFDLYGWNGHNWQYVGVAAPTPNTVNDTAIVIANLDGKMRYYKLYLPIYSEIKSVAVGVESNATITATTDSSYLPRKKVVIYGSSITQGASASRPGMAYPSIVARNYNVETFNLGFSGSGKIEIEVVDVLAKMPADLYVLDCVGNPSPEQIKARTVPFVKKLRSLKPGIPILMVESIFRESGNWDSAIYNLVTNQNRNWKIAYEQLKAEGYDQLYYIKSDGLLGHDHITSLDGAHVTDIGQVRLANCIGKEIGKILKVKLIKQRP